MSKAGGRPSSTDGVQRSSLRARQKERTRELLIEAALKLFASRGYAVATVDDIAAAAGASRATFYLHFKGKSDVIRALIADMPDRQTIWDALERLDRPTKDEVREWIDLVTSVYDDSREYFLAVEQAVAVEPDLTESYYEQIDRYIGQASHALHEPVADARVHGMLLWVQLSRFCFLWRVQRIDIDDDRARRFLIDTWWHALGGRE